MTDADLVRFTEAQARIYKRVVEELTNGCKRTHWMWFVFPQLAALGRSAMAQSYAIRDLDQAKRYLADPILGSRLREAVKLIDELKEISRQHHISASLFADAYIGLGEKDEAMSWLERAYEEHDQWMVYVNSYPGWDPLHSEPRFQALVRRMNFPQ